MVYSLSNYIQAMKMIPCRDCSGGKGIATFHDNNTGRTWTQEYICQVCGGTQLVPDDEYKHRIKEPYR